LKNKKIMLFEDTYKTIETPVEGIFKDRGSKFLAYVYPIEKETEVKKLLEPLKKEHFKAVHFCYAFRLGLGGVAFRANDDSEPSGSAGRPILNVLLSKDLTNILVIVVRYFGGTLLGVPGLINAYKTATEEALREATIIEKTVDETYTISFDYLQMNDVMKVIKDMQLTIVNQRFDNQCEIKLTFRKNLTNQILNKLDKIEGMSYNS
jgi:uncharacterized YigZ family protein